MTRATVHRFGLIGIALVVVGAVVTFAVARPGSSAGCGTQAASPGGSGAPSSATEGAAPPFRQDRPNIVLILTDDQRWDTLAAMPNVRRLLADRGVTFANAFVSDSLCCPSRASILTGQYDQSTGVWSNWPPTGGFPAFHEDRNTIATWLHAAGYRTALIGKYLNRYETSYVPPGWDRWVAFAGGASRYDLYYRYVLNVDGHPRSYGGGPGDYSTNVLTKYAVDFICGAPAGPLFLYYAPYAPHTPISPAPGDHFAGPLPSGHPPSYDEADVSDKPAWVRDLMPMSPARTALVQRMQRATYDTLVSVDRSVGEIVAALRATGRLQNTLIVFTSDNGFSWGEHRWTDKVAGYEEDIRVPMVVRFDPMIPRGGVVNRKLVVNVDLAPTFADAAGVRAPGAEGKSFLPLLRGTRVRWRHDFLLEHLDLLGVPSFCGVRTVHQVYLAYATGEEELYDLRTDPYELTNLAGKPSARALLVRLRDRARALCRPGPPGYPGIPGRPSP